MTGFFSHLVARLKREERGSATVEFVIIVPVYIWLLIMSVETGFITLRHALLERGLDMAVREVRIRTTGVPDYDEIRTLVCDNALFLSDCEANLRLQMVLTDIRNYNSIAGAVLCEDAAQPTSADDNAASIAGIGQPNQLMQVRACYRYKPMFATAALGALQKDANGQTAIVTMSAFVQEPL